MLAEGRLYVLYTYLYNIMQECNEVFKILIPCQNTTKEKKVMS